MSRLAALAALAASCVCACASAPRFRDQPVVWKVADDADIPEPQARRFWMMSYLARILFVRGVERALELHTQQPAGDINALDEVPDSTWFQNRIGVRPVTPEEAALGPAAGGHGPPELPLVVVAAKKGGGNPGFIARDAGGRRFLMKFDTVENPELETTAAVVVNRFFWTLGYNVPADHVTVFAPGELVVPETMGRAIDAILRTSPKTVDGRYRATASELLPGKPKGGWSVEGMRPDDANDRVPHEHRREVRALRVFAAWLGHTDTREDNTLDMYVEENGRHFLRHYLVDFGEALGGHAAEHRRKEDGWEHVWDWELQTRAFFSFGLWRRPWEDLQPTPWRSIGLFRAEGFDPKRWREAYPYVPFSEAGAADRFWAAKLVMRFDRATIAAIVAEGKLSEPAAERHLVNALVARRDAIGRAYLDDVTPLDELRVEGDSVCMVDLAMRYGFAGRGTVDNGSASWPIAADGKVCLPAPPRDRYTVWRLRVRRGGAARAAMQVHLREGRVVGIIRD